MEGVGEGGLDDIEAAAAEATQRIGQGAREKEERHQGRRLGPEAAGATRTAVDKVRSAVDCSTPPPTSP